MKPDMNVIARSPIPWLHENPFDADVAISSRIRLARNVDSVPFPSNADETVLTAVRDTVTDILRNHLPEYKTLWMDMRMNELTENERKLLVERRAISRELNKNVSYACLIMDSDGRKGVMLNEEDHIRAQTIAPGFQLRELWKEIDAFDDLLSTHIPYAFDKRIGYLTSCPTNIGTGMRASVMLHLPGLSMIGQSKQLIKAVNQLHFAIRGYNGEGSEIVSDLYQISNQSTLGESEKDIIERLSAVISQIIVSERAARSKLLERQQPLLMNCVGRAFGILKHSYLISSKEAVDLLLSLRLGVYLGLFDSLSIDDVNRLFRIIQPAHIQMEHAQTPLSSTERGIIRADLLRRALRDK